MLTVALRACALIDPECIKFKVENILRHADYDVKRSTHLQVMAIRRHKTEESGSWPNLRETGDPYMCRELLVCNGSINSQIGPETIHERKSADRSSKISRTYIV